MIYYHIDSDTMTILSGPHAVRSTFIKKLTCCGNPELLDLSVFSLVPMVYPSLTETQKYGAPVVYADRVEFSVVEKSGAEIAEERKAQILGMLYTLDAKVPRGLEDLIDANPSLLAPLPQYTKDILAEKKLLRTEYRMLEEAEDGITSQEDVENTAENATVWAKIKTFFGFN